MSRGKSFETELRNAFRTKHPGKYIERNHDRLTGKWGENGNAISLPSPPDLLVNGGGANGIRCYLIECKAQQGVSIPFMRKKDSPTLSDHQHDYLMDYEASGEIFHGFVAINFYKKRSFKKAWLVPITYWSQYQDRYPRKSLAMKHLEQDLPNYELHWQGKGVWKLPAWA